MNIGSDMGNITSVAVGEVEVIEESRLKETEDQDILKDSVFDFDGEKFTSLKQISYLKNKKPLEFVETQYVAQRFEFYLNK